jgi:hypothetical protein
LFAIGAKIYAKVRKNAGINTTPPTTDVAITRRFHLLSHIAKTVEVDNILHLFS